jgi:uncharacterized membrane protein YhaH (DUF805 family)
MNVLRFFYEPILKAFDFRGRATRVQYWSWFGITFAYYFVLGQVFWAPYVSFQIWADQLSSSSISGLLSVAEVLILAVCWLGPVLPTLAITRRRLIDANAELRVYKYFLISFLVCLVSVPIGLVTFWLLSLIALTTLGVYGFVCMAIATLPSNANIEATTPSVD